MSVNGSKVKVKPFARKMLLQSDGSTNWRYIEVDDDEVESWGPHLEQITIHGLTETRSTNHKWKVVLWYSTDGRTWSSPIDVTTPVTANGDVIHAPFTDPTKLGLHIKLGLAVANVSGTNLESAVVTVAGAFQFLT